MYTTSLFNTLLCIAAIRFAMEQCGVDDFDFFSEGDDNIAGCNEIDIERFVDILSKIGLTTEVQVTEGLKGSNFC